MATLPKMYAVLEYGDILYGKWVDMRKKACVTPEFLNFRYFYDWCMQSGYSYGSWLLRRDSTLPFSPQNCYWKETGKNRTLANADLERAYVLKWNKTVNRFRRHYGLPLFDEEGGG